jgi:hypothetical protein
LREKRISPTAGEMGQTEVTTTTTAKQKQIPIRLRSGEALRDDKQRTTKGQTTAKATAGPSTAPLAKARTASLRMTKLSRGLRMNGCATALFAVGGGDHDGIGVDPGDAEMSAEVDEVERAQLAGDLNDAHVAGGAGENGDAGDVRAVEVKPQVGDSGVGLGGVGGGLVGVDQVLPAGGVIASDDGGHGLRGVEGWPGVVIVVDRDAGECCGGAVGIEAAGEKKILGDLQFAAIKAKGSVAGGLVGEVHERALQARGPRRRLGRGLGIGNGGGEKRGEQEGTETDSHTWPLSC